MGKYFELITQIKPKNGQNFPIADTTDLIGGYIQLESLAEIREHNPDKIRLGMLAYARLENKIYQFIDNWGTLEWVEWSGGSGGSGGNATILKVDTLEDLTQLEDVLSGQLVFIGETQDLRYYDGEN